MVYEHRVGVDRTASQTFPADFVSVLAESELAESEPKRAEHDGVPILLVRRGTRIFALAETCSHFSGPLSEGKVAGDTIECPWHHSRSRWRMAGCSMDRLYTRNRVSKPVCATAALKFVSQFAKRLQ